MPVFRTIFAALLLGGVATAAFAAETPQRECLNKQAQRTAVTSRQAVPLADAVKMLRAHGRRAELVRARLCKGDNNGLVYVLTLLGRSGKVTLATVDAASGNIIGAR